MPELLESERLGSRAQWSTARMQGSLACLDLIVVEPGLVGQARDFPIA